MPNEDHDIDIFVPIDEEIVTTNVGLKKAVLQYVAGAMATTLEATAMHPIDVVKTRLQAQSIIAPEHYNGIIDCTRKMYKFEGIRSFYKGLFIAAIAQAPKVSLKFVVYEQFKSYLKFAPVQLTYVLAGFGAGIIEGALINPLEVVKVHQQTNKAVPVPSTWEVIKLLVRQGGIGLRGLNKGLIATSTRGGTFYMSYFGLYYNLKNCIHHYEDPWEELIRRSSIGFLSGGISAYVSCPFDVLKSRMQGPLGKDKYTSTVKSMRLIAKEEGFTAFYTGMTLRLMRIATGGSIILAFYDYMYETLEKLLLEESERTPPSHH